MKKLVGLIYLMALAACFSLPTGVQATEPEADESGSKIVVHGDDGEEMTVTIADGTVTLVSSEDGSTSTRIIDLEAAGLLAADALEDMMAGMDDVFAELEDMQLDIKLGQDNRLNVSCEDSEFELDLDQVMAQVASAVEMGLQEFDTSEWTHHRKRHHWDAADHADSEDELRAELSDLKAEMKALQAELRNLQHARDDR